MAAFADIPFGKAVEGASNQAMTADNMTELDNMIMNQLAGDDELVQIVSGRGYTDDVRGGNSAGVSLGDALQARVDALNQIARRGGLSESQQYTLDFYNALLKNPRYSSLVISDAVNYSSTGISDTNGKPYTSYIQMACFRLPDGTCVPSFAGTGPEIDSWVEDGRMATTVEGVDAQKAAAEYLNYLMEIHPEARFWVNGYSKGGNAALYAAIRCLYPERLIGVRNFDGPGFGDLLLSDPEFAAQYEALKLRLGDKLFCLSPENSLVGHLMNDHPMYVYLDTDGFVFQDHDYTTWNWLPDGSIQRVETRTDTSLQVEQIMEGLITDFSDAELDRVFDMLSELAMRYDLHSVSDLGNLGLGENGEFSLQVLVSNLMDFWKDQSPQDQQLLKDVLSNVITMENLSMLLASALNDWLAQNGKENPLGTWLTAELLERVLRVLVVAAVIAGAVYAVVKVCTEILNKIRSLVGEALQTLYCAVESAVQKAGEMAGQFFDRLKQMVVNIPENINLASILQTIRSGAQQLGQSLSNGAKALGKWAGDTLSSLWTRLCDGARGAGVTIRNFLDGLADMGRMLVFSAFAKVGSIAFGWASRWSGSITLRIDPYRLDQAYRTTQQAARLSDGLARRLRALMGRLGSEGIRDPENILRTFANLYNLTVSSIVVDFHDDIGGMADRIAQVQQENEDVKNTIRHQLSQLYGTT